MELTVLTPTYNRSNCLKMLYESLKVQTRKDFEWLIVDDGSTDETRTLIDSFVSEDKIHIRYIYKENGGKHTALNTGISQIHNELTFIVDSDDSLSVDAVETIHGYHEKYKNNSEICGYAFLRCYPDGKINGKEFAKDELIASYIETRINSDDSHSDKAEVFFTRCLKEFPFPEYQGEKFLGEDIVWIRMGRKYKMVYINKAIYIGEYLEGGLTNTRRKHNIESPVGCMNRAKEFMDSDLKIQYRVKAALQYYIYGKFAGKTSSTLIKNSPSRFLTILFFFPAEVLYRIWRKKD